MLRSGERDDALTEHGRELRAQSPALASIRTSVVIAFGLVLAGHDGWGWGTV